MVDTAHELRSVQNCAVSLLRLLQAFLKTLLRKFPVARFGKVLKGRSGAIDCRRKFWILFVT